MLLDNDVLHEIVPMLGVSDFYRDVHQTIYQAIRDLYDLGKGIDAVTLADELIRRDQFEKIGGDETLREIVDSVPHAANAKYYAGIVREKAIGRQLIDSATEIIRDGYSNQYTAQELLESAERKVFAIAEEQIQGDTVELKDVITKAMDRIAKRAETGGHAVTGVGVGAHRPGRHHRRLPARPARGPGRRRICPCAPGSASMTFCRNRVRTSADALLNAASFSSISSMEWK